MLALVATAVSPAPSRVSVDLRLRQLHAAIDDCKKGLLQGRNFTANDYWSVYTEHIQTLSRIRSTGAGRQYHTLMHGFWRQIRYVVTAILMVHV